MRNFIKATGVLALSAHADYTRLRTIHEGREKPVYFKSHMGAQNSVEYEGWQLNMPHNSVVVLKDEPYDGSDWNYTPNIQGGSINYWVLMDNMGSGCVAGVYLVAMNDSCDVEKQHNSNEPQKQCPSVDVMQTNDYGFELSTHPCENGNCNDKSRCDYNLRKQGKEKYGADAFGPNGKMINTKDWFQVQTDFVTENNYDDLWKVRTTIRQKDKQIIMEAECKDYLMPLNHDLEGQMAIVVSNWDNTDGRSDFERDDAPNPSSCENSSWALYGLHVKIEGQNEEREDGDGDGDGEDQKAKWQKFIGYVEDWSYAGDGDWYQFFIKGLDGSYLKAEDRSLTIGHNNRAFINDEEWENDSEWAFFHEVYLGGTLSFDVNLAQVPCECATGIFLAHIDDKKCNWHAHPVDQPPQCDTMAIMEANSYGFLTNHKECSSGRCTEEFQCSSGTHLYDGEGTYGPGSMGTFDIDTEKPFHVDTQFFVDQDLDGKWTKLAKVQTTLTQDNAKVVMSNQCPDVFEKLYTRLWMADMAIAISSYNVRSHSAIAPTCVGECTASEAKISNVKWLQETSVNPAEDEDKLIISDKASERLSDCEDGCTECVKAWYEKSPETIVYHCANDTVYRYGNKCNGRRQDKSRCSTSEMDYCFKSYPWNDPKGWKSEANECRTVVEYNRRTDIDWKFHRKNRRNTNGLCALSSDPQRQCANSWDPAIKKKGWKHYTSMARVRPTSA